MDERLKKSRKALDSYYSDEVKRNIRNKIVDGMEDKKKKNIFRPIMIGASLCIMLVLSFVLTQAEFNTASGGSHEKVVENEVVMKESAFSDSDYEQFAVTLTDYELPTEGRLSEEEAIKMLGDRYHPNIPAVVYENGLVFEGDSHYFIDTIDYTDITKIDPYGTQVLALLKPEVDYSSQHKWTVEGYNTPFRMEPLEDLSKHNRESVANGEGWGHLQRGIETQLVILEPFEKQLSKEGYTDLAAWLEETIGYFEQADQFDRENWEKAYQWYVQGSNNIDRMEFELGQVD